MRKPTVSRTFTVTKIIAALLNLQTQKVEEREILLPRKVESEKAIAKAVKCAVGEGYKYIYTKSAVYEKATFYMSEADFMKSATRL